MSFWKWLERTLECRNGHLPRRTDVIIGIGIDVAENGFRSSPQSKAVAEKVSRLFQNRLTSNILLVGGNGKNRLSPTEANLMSKVIARRIPNNKVFLETKSTRTWQNADFALSIMRQQKWRTAIIVAQQWHARRVRATFKKRWQGSGRSFTVIKARSRYGGGSQKRLDSFWRFLIWDTLAFIISKFKGYS